MARAISQTLVKMMVELYEGGMPIIHIADELRLDKVTVHKYLELAGAKEVDPEYSKKSGSRLSDTQKKQIVNLYKRGMTIDHIVEQVGCSAPTLYTYIRKEGLTRQISDDTAITAVRMRIHDNKPVSDIARVTGLSVATIYRRIRDYKAGKLNIE